MMKIDTYSDRTKTGIEMTWINITHIPYSIPATTRITPKSIPNDRKLQDVVLLIIIICAFVHIIYHVIAST